MNILKRMYYLISNKLKFIKNYDEDDFIHSFFGLSYAHYLVLPRSVLQSMPAKWQKKFVKLLNEIGSQPTVITNFEDINSTVTKSNIGTQGC